MAREGSDDVASPERRNGCINQPPARTRVRDVRLNSEPAAPELPDLSCSRVRRLFPAVELEGHIRTLLREGHYRGPSDPATPSRYQGDPPIEASHGDPTFSARNKASDSRTSVERSGSSSIRGKHLTSEIADASRAGGPHLKARIPPAGWAARGGSQARTTAPDLRSGLAGVCGFKSPPNPARAAKSHPPHPVTTIGHSLSGN